SPAAKRALGAKLGGEDFEHGFGVVIESPHNLWRHLVFHTCVSEQLLDSIDARFRLIFQIVCDGWNRANDVLSSRIFAVEESQGVFVNLVSDLLRLIYQERRRVLQDRLAVPG